MEVQPTLTGLSGLSFLLSCIPAMPQHLCCIAKPFAVLSLAWLMGFYLTRGYEVSEFLLTTDNAHGLFLAESEVRHYIENVLQ